jgi:hypothetical protein
MCQWTIQRARVVRFTVLAGKSARAEETTALAALRAGKVDEKFFPCPSLI